MVFKIHLSLLRLEAAIGKSIVNRFAIRFGNYSKIFANLINKRPVADTSITLNLLAKRILQNKFNPFILEIWAARQHTRVEILSCLH